MLLKNSKALEKIAAENANLFVRIGKAILDVLEKAAEDEGLKLSEEIDDSRLTGYRARDRMNKEGELINDFYQALSKKQWATYYRQIANGGYLSSEIGTVFISRIDNKLVFSEKMPITSDTQDFQVVDVWQFDSMDDLDTVYYYFGEIIDELEDDYDKDRIRKMSRRFIDNYDKGKTLFSAYSRTNHSFSDSYTSKGQRLGTEGVYEDSQRGTGREKIPSEDKRYSEREIGVSSEENNESNSREQLKFSEETSEESSEKYSYDALTSKPDITVTEINDKKTYAVNKQTRTDIINAAIANAKNVGRVNANGNAVVRVKDTDTDVIVSKSGVEHSLDRRLNILGAVSENIGSILQNAICINELTPKKASASDSYVYIGAARGANDFYTVQFIVNRYSNELSKIDILYAANAKKEAAALDAPRVTNKSLPITASTISIAELLEYVNRYFPDVLPESVLRHFGHTSRPEGVIGESALYSEETDENTKAVRNERTLRKQVERLKALVKLQGNITHGSVFTDASVGKQVTELRAKYNIKQNANSKVKEALHKFYAFISTAKEFDWNDIQREAGKVAAILLENERLNVGDFFIFM